MIRKLVPVLLVLLAACTPPPRPVQPPPVLPPPPAAPPAPEPPPTEVWTRAPGVVLRGEGTSAVVPFLAMRLEVVQVDGDSLRVRCLGCRGEPGGWVRAAEVVRSAPEPAMAARMELADFVLAVRQAAVRRDVFALRQVMSRGFIHSEDAPEGGIPAEAAWGGARFHDLTRLPSVLDRGVVSVEGTDVWAAPPEWVTVRGYQDLRAGFRRGADGWEWIFLVRADSR